MMTLVLSFFSTISSAAEKNSALSPSLISPSTYRMVKFSVCFFSTINRALPRSNLRSDASKSEAMYCTDRYHSIHPAEAERIRNKELSAGATRCVRDVVEIAGRVGRGEVDRRREKAVVQR